LPSVWRRKKKPRRKYMNYVNLFGLFFMVIIMIPNIIYAVKCRDGFKNVWRNKTVELLEQIGRFACFFLMIFIIPHTGFGFPSDEAFAVYLIADTVLVTAYCLVWIVCFRKNSRFRALALSVLPSILFLFSGVMSRYLPLVAAALIFAPCHILISCKNVK